jgi:REP element-mobilizing transposase RayT
MILGMHLTISCYGHWQPNDPRGSGSRFVGSKKLYAVGGKATKVETRHSVAHAPHDVCLRLRIKESLKYPPVLFSDQQIETVGNALGTLLEENRVSVFACTIVADHVHLLIGRTEIHVDELVLSLKETAVAALLRDGLHPRAGVPEAGVPAKWGDDVSLTAAASVWSVGYWKVFIDNSERMRAAIRYINNHHSSQHWSFVVPYI